MPKEKRKFSIYLARDGATKDAVLSASFLDKIEDEKADRLQPLDESAELDGYFLLSKAKVPRWMDVLSDAFSVPDFSRKSPAAVVVFEAGGRVFAVTFGFGSKLLNEHQLEGDFGLKVAINSVADDALKAVQKSNVASAIQQFAQASFKSRFGSFGGQNKFEILRRVAGTVSADEDIDSVVGGGGLSLVTQLKLSEIRDLAVKALQFYQSSAYLKTAFAVVDEFKPVLAQAEIGALNDLLVTNVRSEQSSFELCLPQLTLDDTGYAKIQGAGLAGEFPDVSLELYKSSFDTAQDIELSDLMSDTVSLFNDEHDTVGRWSVFRSLIGSLEGPEGKRYVLNEGHWYLPAAGIVGPVESYFTSHKAEPDPELGSFAVTSWEKEYGKKGKIKNVPVYEREEDFNERIAKQAGYVLFDQKWHEASDGSFDKLEVCDLYDHQSFRMIHVKRTSRQPAMVSYLFEQGQRSADLWQRDDVRQQFIARVRTEAGDAAADALEEIALVPGAITVEYAIADYENNQGNHTIPFLGKLAFENRARDVELRGFKVVVRFIPLAKPHVA